MQDFLWKPFHTEIGAPQDSLPQEIDITLQAHKSVVVLFFVNVQNSTACSAHAWIVV